uniref:Uncharacterized protein n=1 Tax=Glossina austeni TaxID=7395 RepID=A0A1A9VKK7_GLOAU
MITDPYHCTTKVRLSKGWLGSLVELYVTLPFCCALARIKDRNTMLYVLHYATDEDREKMVVVVVAVVISSGKLNALVVCLFGLCVSPIMRFNVNDVDLTLAGC